MPRSVPPPIPRRQLRKKTAQPAAFQMDVGWMVSLGAAAVLAVIVLATKLSSSRATGAVSTAASAESAAVGGGETASSTSRAMRPLSPEFERQLNQIRTHYAKIGYAIVTVESAPQPAADAEYYLIGRLQDAANCTNRQQRGSTAQDSDDYYHPIVMRNAISVLGGSHGDNTHTYFLGPVKNFQAFASKLKFGDTLSVDPSTFSIFVKSSLPTPCPDTVEELQVRRAGAGTIIRIEFTTDVPKDLGRADHAIHSCTTRFGVPSSLLTSGPRGASRLLYLYTALPLQQITERINIGRITAMDEETRRIAVTVSPDQLSPVASETSAGTLALNLVPEPFEDDDPVDWALQILRHRGSRHHGAALKELARTPVRPDRLDEVVKEIVEIGLSKDAHRHRRELIDAGDRWHGPALARLAIARVNEDGWDAKRLIPWLITFPSSEGAEAIAKLLTSTWHKNEAADALPKLGPVAEATVVTLLQQADREDRPKFMQMLETIGGSKSIEALELLRRKESRKSSIAMIDRSIATIRRRLGDQTTPDAAEDTGAENSSSENSSGARGRTPNGVGL